MSGHYNSLKKELNTDGGGYLGRSEPYNPLRKVLHAIERRTKGQAADPVDTDKRHKVLKMSVLKRGCSPPPTGDKPEERSGGAAVATRCKRQGRHPTGWMEIYLPPFVFALRIESQTSFLVIQRFNLLFQSKRENSATSFTAQWEGSKSLFFPELLPSHHSHLFSP